MSVVFAQGASEGRPSSAPKFVTVPFTLDHDRVVIEVGLPLPDGSQMLVNAWVDSGNPEFDISQRLSQVLGLKMNCNAKTCSAPPPREITIAGMSIPLDGLKDAEVPGTPNSGSSVIAPGMSAEISLPSSILRHYDVLVDFPGRKFTIGLPGSIKFKGIRSKIQVNGENGLIQVPSQIENKKYNLALDLGASISFLSEEVFNQLAAAHPAWPNMTGAVGPANMWGLDEEPKWKLMRIERLQYGPLYLTGVAVVDFPKDRMAFFAKRAGIATAGLLGSEALLNYRVGLDYAHATAYFDIGSTFKFPDFEVIGLILRPEDDGRFTILGVADVQGKSSVPGVQPGDQLVAIDATSVPGSTMGQVWSLLQGQPSQERKLSIERERKRFIVAGKVQGFLATPNDETPEAAKPKR
jgi:hypothetical protein